MKVNQLNFDFKDWESAFARFYEEKKVDSKICLIISTGDYTSGYWIERYDPLTTKTEDSTVYRSVKSVKALENLVRTSIEASKARHFSGESSASIGLII